MSVKKLNISHIPGEFNKRVFIGGNYESMPVLRQIEDFVLQCEYTPIIAYDFQMPSGFIHEYTMLLLHNCRYAIFEITRPSGELMELERVRDYGNISLLVYQVKNAEEVLNLPGQINQMLATMTGVTRIGYHDFDTLKKQIQRFLMPRYLWGSNFPFTAILGILGREPSSEEWDIYKNMLEAQQITEYQLATLIITSEEYKKMLLEEKTNSAYIKKLYKNILNREPEDEEFANALNQLENNLTTKQQLLIDFIQIDEVCTTIENVLRASHTAFDATTKTSENKQ